MSRDETSASPFAALFEWDKENGGGGGGRAKIQVRGGGKSGSGGGKLRLGGGQKAGVRRFHKGHRLANTKINNIVKVKYVKNNHDAARHIIQHINYIEKRERDINEPERKFYGRDGERSRDDVVNTCMQNRGDDAAMFKIILSPKQNELNHIEYTTEIMRRFEEKTGLKIDWSMVEHKNTEYHHVHLVLPGRDMNGHSYRLEPEHLELLRELANEHQYEIQGMDYEYEKQIEQEFGLARDEVELIRILGQDRKDMRDLGVTRPEVDKLVRDELLTPTNFDEVYFAQQLQKEMLMQVSKDFKDLQSELAQTMQERHPELYPGFVKQMQAEEINNAFFSRLKDFHPAEYHHYIHDPTLDRTPVYDRLKQAFPEWFDPIVDQLKRDQPKLFANYEKPGPTERELMDNLRQTSPQLFPQLSKQIQENQLNTVTMAMLATVNPSRLEQILDEQDPERQRQLLNQTRADYPDIVSQAREGLAKRFPDIYKHGERSEPSDRDIMAQLVRDHPTLFPQATAELQKLEIDNALIEQLREVNPELAKGIDSDPHARGVATTFMRCFMPEQLKKATDLVRGEHPELFQYERQEPSEREIMLALEKEHPELYPNAMRSLKQQEINKAYFERGVQSTPDGLKAFLENPELDRTELYRVLQSKHPEWRQDIEKELKERRPELFKFDRQYPTDDERIAELQKTNPELFPGMKRAEPVKELEIERSPKLEKLEQIKEQLVDRGIFEKGREELGDGLVEYLMHAEYDRKYIIDGLKLSHPDWVQEIEGKLRNLHPQLFTALDKETEQATKEAQERAADLQKLAGEHLPERFAQEATLLIAIATGKEIPEKEVEREVGDLDKDERDDSEKGADKENSEHVLDAAEDALARVENIKTGKEWAGLMMFQDPSFVDDPLDLTAEAQALFDSQQEISKELQDFESDAMMLDPNLFKLEETLDDVEKDLGEIDKDDSDRAE